MKSNKTPSNKIQNNLQFEDFASTPLAGKAREGVSMVNRHIANKLPSFNSAKNPFSKTKDLPRCLSPFFSKIFYPKTSESWTIKARLPKLKSISGYYESRMYL